MSEIPRYHQSAVGCYLKCGKQYEFRYIQGLKVRPRAALTVGRAVDEAVSFNLENKIGTGIDAPLEQVEAICSDVFDELSLETDWKEDSPGEQKDMSLSMTRAHHEILAPTIDPETVQEEFHIELDGKEYSIGGTFDLTTKDGVLVDTKTSRLKYEPESIQTNTQPVLYDFAYEALRQKKAKSFRYDVLIKPTKTLGTRVQQVEGVVTEKAREFLFETLDQVHKGIKAGVAMPAAESSWFCSKNWCGYWDMCKGKK